MKKYKSICMYDAEKKKNICKTITLSKFKTKKELDKKIEQLKANQKIKNKQYKDKKKSIDRDNILSILNEMNNMNKMKNIDLKNINSDIMNAITKIKFNKKIKLLLDKNTGNSIIILGSSKRGKTSAMMSIYSKYYNKNKYISTAFSENIHIKEYKGYKNLLKCRIFNNQSENYIKLEKFINSKCDNKYEFVNLFDDILDLRYNNLIKNLILSYRNAKMSTILALQDPVLLNRNMRQNANNILFFGFNSDDTIEFVINHFLKSHFRKLGVNNLMDQIIFYQEITKNHGFIYLHPETGNISFNRLKL